MTTTVTLQEYERAERELMDTEERRGFLIHTAAFVLVNLLLIGINLTLIVQTSDDFVWFVFPLAGWTIGLVAHYVFGIRQLTQHITARQQQIERRAATSAGQ